MINPYTGLWDPKKQDVEENYVSESFLRIRKKLIA